MLALTDVNGVGWQWSLFDESPQSEIHALSLVHASLAVYTCVCTCRHISSLVLRGQTGITTRLVWCIFSTVDDVCNGVLDFRFVGRLLTLLTIY